MNKKKWLKKELESIGFKYYSNMANELNFKRGRDFIIIKLSDELTYALDISEFYLNHNELKKLIEIAEVYKSMIDK